MDAKNFREIEELYKDLKARLEAGEISGEDMKAEMKKMMLRDEMDRFWMLGMKTGGWYVYDGSAWKEADPYGAKETSWAPQQEMPQPTAKMPSAAAPDRGQGHEDSQEILCKFCRSRLSEHDVYCKFCGGNQKAAGKTAPRQIPSGELLFKTVHIPSLMFFMGGVGLIAGVILGASFGIFSIFGDLIYQFPLMLQEMRGKIQGGLFFGALGGIFGFVAFALLAVIKGLFLNLIAYVFGGIRFKVKS